jgi:RNA polymerase sigma factor (sigma-70 family)
MTDSQKLLAEYVANGSEAAFRELVARYINLVYSTALRLVGGDAHLAEDVTQTVFISLARKARSLSNEVMLGGWLHQHTYYVATKAVRSERRRQSREREAVEMNTLQDDSGASLRQVAPMLDEAITQLGSEDRTAILLRFFEQRDFRAVGEALGSSEDAARMRVNRALEKLHSLLKRRGVTLSAAALGTALTAGAVNAAPAGLAATVSTAALAGAAAGTGTTLTITKLITMTKLQAGIIGAILVAGVTTTLVIRHQATTTPPAAALSYQQLVEFLDSHQKLPREQIEAYLQKNQRSADSLLAAYKVSQDPAYLREAAASFPDTPAVQFAVVSGNVFPGGQRKWIDAFKASSPDNALAWYFSALDYFNSNQPDLAVPELAEATRRQSFDIYAAQNTQAMEEMCLLAGWPPLPARAWALSRQSNSHLTSLKNLAGQMMQAQQLDLARGDAASANSLAAMGMVLGNTLRARGPIEQLMGIGIEKKILAQLDPAVNYDFLDRPVSEALAELDRQKQAIADALKNRDQVRPTLNAADLVNYFEHEKLYGEMNALQWLQSTNRQP